MRDLDTEGLDSIVTEHGNSHGIPDGADDGDVDAGEWGGAGHS